MVSEAVVLRLRPICMCCAAGQEAGGGRHEDRHGGGQEGPRLRPRGTLYHALKTLCDQPEVGFGVSCQAMQTRMLGESEPLVQLTIPCLAASQACCVLFRTTCSWYSSYLNEKWVRQAFAGCGTIVSVDMVCDPVDKVSEPEGVEATVWTMSTTRATGRLNAAPMLLQLSSRMVCRPSLTLLYVPYVHACVLQAFEGLLFISFSTPLAAQTAVQKNDTFIGSWPIKVEAPLSNTVRCVTRPIRSPCPFK